MLGAREYALAEDPLLRSTADALAASSPSSRRSSISSLTAIRVPSSAGRGPAGSALALSTGLLGAPTPAELEAVIAHELAHVRRRDVLTQTSAVMLAVVLVDLSRIGGWFERALLLVLGPDRGSVRPPLLSPRRELRPIGWQRGSWGQVMRSRTRQARPGERPRLLSGEPGDRAALPVRPFAEEAWPPSSSRICAAASGRTRTRRVGARRARSHVGCRRAAANASEGRLRAEPAFSATLRRRVVRVGVEPTRPSPPSPRAAGEEPEERQSRRRGLSRPQRPSSRSARTPSRASTLRPMEPSNAPPDASTMTS